MEALFPSKTLAIYLQVYTRYNKNTNNTVHILPVFSENF
jgi:hypothetical protein